MLQQLASLPLFSLDELPLQSWLSGSGVLGANLFQAAAADERGLEEAEFAGWLACFWQILTGLLACFCEEEEKKFCKLKYYI